jgi:DNA polymerase-4
MDAFFASVELVGRPDLRGKPVVVARDSDRSVVVAATYEARALGVHAAMPAVRARRLAPGAVFVEPHHAHYREVSRGVMDLLREVTPVVEQVSVDEAFLDVTGSVRRLGPPRQIAEQIRAEVRRRFQITASAGIGRSKSVAKIASTMAKPDGLLEVPPDETLRFLRPLPVGSLWGVGPATLEAFRRLAIRTVGELADSPDGLIRRALGEASGRRLLELARGVDSSPVAPGGVEKSISAETTFERDLPRGAALDREVARLADKVAWRLREADAMCRAVGCKIRGADFTTASRSKTLPGPTDSTKLITSTALALVAQAPASLGPIRLVGVRVDQLLPRHGAPVQAAFGEEDAASHDVDRVRDQVRRRFGGDALM